MAEDSDWFRISLTEGQLYTFDARGEGGRWRDAQNPNVILRDADGNCVTGGYEELLFLAENCGTYYAEVNGLW